MPVTDSFIAFVFEQLEGVGPITSKRMFGGVGLYADDCFFAIMMNDTVYLKADVTNRAKFLAAGGRPFQPYPDRPAGGGTMQYYSVPVAILEDGEELMRWAKTSVAVARSARNTKPSRSRR